MTNSKSHPDFDTYSVEEFMLQLQEILPFWEEVIPRWQKLITAAKRLLGEKATKSTPLPCHSCAKECVGPCKLLNSMLPKRYGGKTPGETTIKQNFDDFRSAGISSDGLREEENQAQFDRSKLKNIRKVTSVDVFEQYKKCWGLFTDKQREVLFLRYREGKTIKQIAKALEKAPSTVCVLLKRAEKRKQEYDDKELEKILRLKRKMRTE